MATLQSCHVGLIMQCLDQPAKFQEEMQLHACKDASTDNWTQFQFAWSHQLILSELFVIYRKSSNVLLTENDSPKISDHGLARTLQLSVEEKMAMTTILGNLIIN